jgi:hypothetical protein
MGSWLKYQIHYADSPWHCKILGMYNTNVMVCMWQRIKLLCGVTEQSASWASSSSTTTIPPPQPSSSSSPLSPHRPYPPPFLSSFFLSYFFFTHGPEFASELCNILKFWWWKTEVKDCGLQDVMLCNGVKWSWYFVMSGSFNSTM